MNWWFYMTGSDIINMLLNAENGEMKIKYVIRFDNMLSYFYSLKS